MLLAIVCIAAAVLVGIARFAFELVPGTQESVRDLLSDSLGREVQIGDIDLGWSHWYPSVHLQDVTVMNEAGTDEWLRFDALSIGLSKLGLLSGEIQPTEVRLREPVLDLSVMGEIGEEAGATGSQDSDADQGESLRNLGRTLSRLGALIIENGELHLPDPWDDQTFLRLTEVNMSLTGGRRKFAVTATAMLPPSVGGQLNLDVEADGDFSSLAMMEVAGEASVENPDPGFWLTPLLQPGSRVNFNESTLRAQFSGSLKSLNSVDVDADIQGLALSGDPVIWPEARLRAAIRPSRIVEEDRSLEMAGADHSRWEIKLTEFAVRDAAGMESTTTGSASWTPDTRELRVDLDRVDLANWSPWLKIAAPVEGVGNLADLQPSGVLLNTRLEMRGEVAQPKAVDTVVSTAPVEDSLTTDASDSVPVSVPSAAESAAMHFRFSTDLESVACQPLGAIPGVSGISGRLVVGQENGSFELRGSEGQLALPEVFHETLKFRSLKADLQWQRSEAGWDLQGQEVSVELAGGLQARGGMRLGFPDADISPSIDLDMRFAGDDVLSAKALIPRDPEVFPVEVQEWLRASILGGKVSNGRVRIQGLLKDFPYENHDEPGLFQVDLDLRAGRLVYAEGWPGISDIAAKLLFRGRRMEIEASGANILGFPVGPVTTGIRDYKESILRVEGRASAPAANMLGFLRESPLHAEFEHMLAVLDLNGPADLLLNLQIPLDDVDATEVNGHILLSDNELRHSALPSPLKRISGDVYFDNAGVRADRLAGTLFDQPVLVNLAPRRIRNGSEESTVIDVVANTAYSLPRDRAAIASYLPESIIARAQGTAKLQLKMAIAESPDPTPIDIELDLANLGLDLPKPFGKAVGTAQTARLHMLPRPAGGADLQASYGSVGSASLRWGGTPDVWQLERGLIRIGREKPAQLPREAGLWLEGTYEQLDLGAWRKLLAAETPAASTAPDSTPFPLRGAELRIQELLVAGQKFKEVRAQVNRHPDTWWASLEGPDLNGILEWDASQPRPTIQATIKSLSLGTLSEEEKALRESESAPTDPRGLPGLALNVDRITINNTPLGSARLVLNPVSAGLRLAVIEVNGTGLDLNGKGEWTRDAAGSSARIALTISGNQIDSLLSAAGYDPTLTAKKTDIDLDIRWAPNPEGVVPESMYGLLNLKLEEGALLAVDPGAGRALGLLNFYALPRRLQFDFEDVTSDGLVFDELKGKFEIANGNAYTDTLRMEGPSLKMRISGRTGIAARDYDQIVNIVPNIKSGVTLAGTVLGGPAVGAALLIAQELFEKPLDKISELQYHLGGTWDDPVVGDVGNRKVQTAPPARKPPIPVPARPATDAAVGAEPATPASAP